MESVVLFCVVVVLRFVYFMYMCALFACGPLNQKRASDPTRDGCQPPCSCWGLNSGALEEQPVLSTSESSLLYPVLVFLWLGLHERKNTK